MEDWIVNQELQVCFAQPYGASQIPLAKCRTSATDTVSQQQNLKTSSFENGNRSLKSIAFPDHMQLGRIDGCREGGGVRILHRLLHYIPERAANRERWVGALQNTVIPLRLIDGGADPVSGAHLYYYYLEQIPNADAVLFENIGHYPHTEAPDAVASAFLDFHKAQGTVDA